MRLPKLSSLEAYESPEVILKFARDYNFTASQARKIFKETMKMLWLMVKHNMEVEENSNIDIPEAFNIHKPMDILDKMWHEFILFTNEYHQFCQEFFGCYLHHIPCSEKEFQAFKMRALEQQDGFVACERQRIEKFVRYVKDNLGIDTLTCWFIEMPTLQQSK